jgi:abhydrolase domain-containing protein 13
VENTFLSIPQLIPRVVPILKPFAFLCNQRWNSHQVVPSLTQKALFLSGKRDELIPPDHMMKLHQSARKAVYKKLVLFEKGTHNDTCIQEGYFEAIEEFLRTTPKTPRVTVEEITDEDDYE